jgi:hypothetical protein
MTSYTDIFNHYPEHFYYRVEQEYSWYKQASNLRDAVERAFLSINEKGEVEDHQSDHLKNLLSLYKEMLDGSSAEFPQACIYLKKLFLHQQKRLRLKF